MFKYLQGYGIHHSSLLFTKESINKIHFREGWWGGWGTHTKKPQDLSRKFTKRKGEILKTTKGQTGNCFQFISFIADAKEMTDLLPKHADPPASREL